MISYWLDMKIWKRKEAIFLIKICSAILESNSGLIDELKYYGEERTMIDFFQSEEGEESVFFSNYQE
jgi:hypothetical protein